MIYVISFLAAFNSNLMVDETNVTYDMDGNSYEILDVDLCSRDAVRGTDMDMTMKIMEATGIKCSFDDDGNAITIKVME